MLRARDCVSVEPLLPLQQLTELRLQEATSPAAELMQLSRLANLSSIAVRYGWDRDMAAAAEAFGQLPALKCLDLGVGGYTELELPVEQVLQHLARATQLTRLVISSPEDGAMTPEQLVDVIRRLTGLRELVLRHVRLRQPQQQQQQQGILMLGPDAAVGSSPVLAAAISVLPQLQRVIVWDSSMRQAELTGTGAAAAAAAKGWSEHQFWLDE
jgi:hypothetical protein